MTGYIGKHSGRYCFSTVRQSGQSVAKKLQIDNKSRINEQNRKLFELLGLSSNLQCVRIAVNALIEENRIYNVIVMLL